MKSALVTILFLYAASRAGRLAMKLLRVREWAGGMSFLYETGAGMWLLSISIFGLSAAGRCDSRAILGLLISAAVAAAAMDIFHLSAKKNAAAAQAAPRPSTPESSAPRPSMSSSTADAPKNIFAILAPAIAIILAASMLNNIIRCFMPPIDFDALSYHLAVPRQYLLAGKIIDLPTILYSNFPLAAEMMFLPGLAAGAPASAALIHTAFGIMTAALIYAWMKRHFAPETALLGAAIFYLTPLVGIISPSALVDLAVAFYSFAAISALAPPPGGEQYDTRRHAAAVLFAGVATSVKWPGALILFLVAGYITHKTLLSRNSGPGRRPAGGAARALATLAALAILSLAPVLPYLVKNHILSGNPVYPMLFNIFGGNDLDWDSAAAIIGGIREHARTASSPWHIFIAPWDMAMKEGSFQGILSPVYLCLVPLCAVVKKNRAALFALTFALLYFPMWYFFLNLSLRLFMPALPLLAVAAAHAASGLCELRLSKISAAFVALNLFLGLAAGLFGSAGLRQNLPVISGRVSDNSFLSVRISEFGAVRWINSNAWPDDRVMLGEILVQGYNLNLPYVWGHPGFQGRYRYDRMRGGDDLFIALRRDRVSLILFRADPTAPGGLSGQFRFFLDENGERVWREFLRDHVRPVYKSNNASVFRVLF